MSRNRKIETIGDIIESRKKKSKFCIIFTKQIHTSKKRKDLVEIMRKTWIVCGLIIVMGTAIVFGIYLANRDKAEQERIDTQTQAKFENQIERENREENLLETASTEEKVSPNAMLQKRVYYTKCDHLMQEEEKVKPEEVNCTKEEFEKRYTNWKIEMFSPDRIEIYQEVSKTCPQHFRLRENEGVIVIDQADENGKYHEIEQTEINTKYLSEEDQAKLATGILIVGENKLNSTLEDYE